MLRFLYFHVCFKLDLFFKKLHPVLMDFILVLWLSTLCVARCYLNFFFFQLLKNFLSHKRRVANL